jgi:hypothetical protein
MSRKIVLLLSLILFVYTSAFAENKRFFIPQSRTHSPGEIARDIGFLYACHWAGYLILFEVLSDAEGSLEKYKKNFFLNNIQWWDGDSFGWNFVGHPYIGSQTYLYYRARGYNKSESFWGSFAACLLFESTIEVFHDSFSFNDVVITPISGYVLGNWIEKKSIEMINSDDKGQQIIARIINPSLNFKFYEGVTFTPIISSKNIGFVLCYKF